MEVFESYAADGGKGLFDVEAHLFHFLAVIKVAVVNVFLENHIFGDVPVDWLVLFEVGTREVV